MKNIVLLYLLIALNISVLAQDKNEEVVDHLALATLMIYDGKYDVAREELSQVNQNELKFDNAKYYTVWGVLYSKLEDHKKAIKSFEEAIRATKIKVFEAPKVEKKEKYLFSIGGSEEKQKELDIEYNPEAVRQDKIEQLYMYLSQEYYKMKDYRNTLLSLDKAGLKGKSRAALYTLRAECYWKLEDHSNAINALSNGLFKYPKDTTLLKQKFYYFADLKLYHAAIDASKEYMELVGASASEYIALAQMLIGGNQVHEAIKLLEEAKLYFPKEAKIGILLGHMYLKQNMQHTTAHLFEESSYYDKQYLKDAVEMHRRAKNRMHALYLNSQNPDNVEKIKQNIAIFIESGEYAKVIGLKKGMMRYNMLEDDNLRYALAYAYYMSGDYNSAEEHLKKIVDSELFSKATVIRKNIEKCKNNSMECF